MKHSGRKGLPGGIRFAAIVGLVLSILTGWAALMEAVEMVNFYEARSLRMEQELPRIPGAPALDAKTLEVYYAALEPMREPRAVLLGLLAVACAFVSVSAARMLNPEHLPRDAMRRVLSRAAIIAAGLRTIDGAQMSVAKQRLFAALAEPMSKMPEFPPDITVEASREILSAMGAGSAIFGTVVVAGTFAFLGQYFRSQGVREAVAVQDGPQEE
ncbi:hypothetical protein HUW63_19885 [Myxococcus sp. AM001]|uniref:hypothetical protein n=1 Tax=unclassified Myxococcus TaxID=2648731 RepID=UPI0015951642|nr:hypothetical protein [Myxococcus sp. AM009]NVJ07491.1 hypothetical protein [Myxococcus sp. AM001]NVJ15640.1 hypothetical protein [Myxococcus sp. AM010]